MSKFDIQSLLSEVSAEAPCGEDLSYDQSYLALERLVQPKPGGVLGAEDSIEEPNWSEVCEKSFQLLQRSKDLRVVMYFTLALLKLEGFPGLRDGLFLLRGLLERFWDHIYPQLDPDDNNDPLERINILSSLSPTSVTVQDPMKFKQRLLEVPLCNSSQMGKFNFRHIQIAKGAIAVSGDQAAKAPEMSVIDAAFQDTPMEELQTTFQAVEEAVEHINATTNVFSERAFQGQAPNLSDFQAILQKIHKCVQEYLAKQGITVDVGSVTTVGQGAAAIGSKEGKGGISLSGEIRSTKEALMVLDKVCRYFDRHEPSSPVPLLLRRAQKLVSKSFLEVIKDFCPEAISKVEMIGGVSSDSGAGGSNQ